MSGTYSMKIIDFSYEVVNSKLKSPYSLSYKKLYSYESVITRTTLQNGDEILGEVTPLVGYTDETIESISSDLREYKNIIVGKSLLDVLDNFKESIEPQKAFSISSFLPSLEYYHQFGSSNKITINRGDLVYAFDCVNLSIEEIDSQLAKISQLGYNTLKIKVGKDIDRELLMIEKLSKSNLDSIKIRFDANSGYNYEESSIFLERSSIMIPNHIEYLEQPLCRSCWDEMKKLIELNYSTPIMIDESIYSIVDIQRSHDIGAKYIKLKLCKYGSLHDLQKALDFSLSLGLKVIFGNGVATDISNLIELDFYLRNRDKIYGATESVGFSKIDSVLKNTIVII